MAAFAIKAPLFPFHTWLPLVHTEAPTAGSVVLAGVIIKMGAYGFVRFSFELFPQASVDMAPIMMVLAVIGIIYGAVVAAMQTDLKRIIAYSSVAHMGFVILGIFSLSVIGLDGAVFTMVSHPLTTGALFLVIGMLYERRHTRELSAYRGVWKVTPILGGFFLTAMFAGIGLPGFSGFIGEFLSLLGAFIWDRPYAIVATFGVILAAVYGLWAFQRAFTGKPTGENLKMKDVSLREVLVVVPLLGLSLFLGLYPKPVLDRIQPAIELRVHNLERKSDYRNRSRRRSPSRSRTTRSTPRVTRPRTRAGRDVRSRRTHHTARGRLAGDRARGRARGRGRARRPGQGDPAPPRGGDAGGAADRGLGVVTAGAMLIWQWNDVKDDGADHHDERDGARRRLRRVPRRRSS